MRHNPHSFEALYENYIRPLGGGADTFHAQLFPGVYTTDQESFEIVRRTGKPQSVDTAPPDFLLQRRMATAIGAPFKRLCILPDVGFRKPTPKDGKLDTYTQEDVEAIMNMARRSVAAGELVCTATFGDVSQRLREALPHSSLAQEYLAGAESGVSKHSFWSVHGARNTLEAVQLMSYEPDGTFSATILLPPYSPELTDYVEFWEQEYATATPLR